MKIRIPTQLIVGLGILLIGSGIIGGEYLLVRWYPAHRAAVVDETLELKPFKNEGLGVEMQVAGGFYEKTEIFPGGVRIFSPRFWRRAPTITITSQPNPDASSEFTPQQTAIWETDGVQHHLPRYHYEETHINGRDAVLIWQSENRTMVLTARVISPERIVEVQCTPGSAEEGLYMQACEESVQTINVAGPPSAPATPGLEELSPNPAPAKQ